MHSVQDPNFFIFTYLELYLYFNISNDFSILFHSIVLQNRLEQAPSNLNCNVSTPNKSSGNIFRLLALSVLELELGHLAIAVDEASLANSLFSNSIAHIRTFRQQFTESLATEQPTHPNTYTAGDYTLKFTKILATYNCNTCTSILFALFSRRNRAARTEPAGTSVCGARRAYRRRAAIGERASALSGLPRAKPLHLQASGWRRGTRPSANPALAVSTHRRDGGGRWFRERSVRRARLEMRTTSLGSIRIERHSHNLLSGAGECYHWYTVPTVDCRLCRLCRLQTMECRYCTVRVCTCTTSMKSEWWIYCVGICYELWSVHVQHPTWSKRKESGRRQSTLMTKRHYIWV